MEKNQYKKTPNAHVEHSKLMKEKGTAPVLQNVKYDDSGKTELASACLQVFDSMVTRDFLHSLSECTVRHLEDTSKYSKVRWFRIDKIVMEKDVFFADKLSMLYMSLHKTAKNIILVLNKQNDGDIELYLGARDFSGSSCVSGNILKAGLEGYFPGIKFQQKQISKLKFSYPTIASVSAIASLRDDKKENFVQGIERLINATSSIPQFRAYFIADSVGDAETNSMISAFNNLYSSLSPAETLQMTFNESETKGVSQSFTENFSESIGESISKTVTHTDGYSENNTESDTETNGSSENYSQNILASIWHGIAGGRTGGGVNHSSSSTRSQTIGKNFSDSEANQKGTSINTTKGAANQTGSNESTTIGSSKQITYKNRSVKFYLDILDKQLERLQNGRPFGLWSVATYFVANDPTTAQELSNIYRGSIIGEESGLETCAINIWEEKETVTKINHYLVNSLHPRFNFNSLDVSAGSVVNSKELAIHLSLPQSSVPGIIVQERASFARNVFSNKKENEAIEIGKIVHLDKECDTPVKLDIDELTKHTFITGTTGSGKSNTMYLLLNELLKKGKKFLVIEPAKGEYKNIFGGIYKLNTDNATDGTEKETGEIEVKVYGSNPNFTRLLRINPFEFPHEVHVYEHIDRLVDIFNACWPMYAAMPVVLKKAISDAYKNCGWDLDLSTCNVAFDEKLFPTIKDVVYALQDYINNSEYSEQTKGDYKGSLETRLLSLSEGLTGAMLNNTKNLTDKELFDENVIVDLSRVNNSETKSLIMGMLIMKLSEYYQSSGQMNSKLNHVTVLEEAHNILKRTSTIQNQESSNLVGKSVEMISNSIAEMRTYGEGFIIVDQSPSQVDMSAIRNTNTKIVMALLETDDKECAGKSIGLTDVQVEEISRQKVGQAIVFQNGWEEAVQCKIIHQAQVPETLFESQKDTIINTPSNTNNETIIRFLFACSNESVEFKEFEAVKQEILQSSYPSSIKYNLLRILSDYQNQKFKMDERNRAKLLELTGVCLGEYGYVQKILNVKKNVSEINASIKDLVQRTYSIEDPMILRFCIRSMIRLQASKSSKVVPSYNEWFKTYYKLCLE